MLEGVIIGVGAFFGAFGETIDLIVVAPGADDGVKAKVDDVDAIDWAIDAFAVKDGDVDGRGFAVD